MKKVDSQHPGCPPLSTCNLERPKTRAHKSMKLKPEVDGHKKAQKPQTEKDAKPKKRKIPSSAVCGSGLDFIAPPSPASNLGHSSPVLCG